MRHRPQAALEWAVDMFGEVARDPRERTMRFLEEAVELAHAMGLDAITATNIIARVYSRPQGTVPREIGQARMTLEVLAANIEIDDEAEAEKEFERVQTIPKDSWQRRHAAKQAIGIAQR